eukprot:scaffold12558_cov60-Phaeocystis_antarctica.AAC.2
MATVRLRAKSPAQPASGCHLHAFDRRCAQHAHMKNVVFGALGSEVYIGVGEVGVGEVWREAGAPCRREAVRCLSAKNYFISQESITARSADAARAYHLKDITARALRRRGPRARAT